tara:strand:- start:1333 stop:1677 length:345 start_codon:yes stop_codon:yes gene_type:complete
MKKVLCFDLDNVICKTKKNNYKTSRPIKKNIKKINTLYDNGFVIKIFTARYMGRNNDNRLKAYRMGYKLTKFQLRKWKVKFHKLIFGKPSYDLFVDDKAIFFKKNWINSIDKYL